jgi:hypothetical protein
MFWSVGDDFYNADALLEDLNGRIKKAIEKQASGKISREDLQLLQHSEPHLYVPLSLPVSNDWSVLG